jgi:hypothetical protein
MASFTESQLKQLLDVILKINKNMIIKNGIEGIHAFTYKTTIQMMQDIEDPKNKRSYRRYTFAPNVYKECMENETFSKEAIDHYVIHLASHPSDVVYVSKFFFIPFDDMMNVKQDIDIILTFDINHPYGCSVCGEIRAKKCAGCKFVYYCSKECQQLHWQIHKPQCLTKQRIDEQNAKKI